MSSAVSSRVEFRVTKEDKDVIEYARELMGFKSFSEFARYIIMTEARSIIKERSTILASEKDKEIFFNELMGKNQEPNQALISAIDHHNSIVGE